MAAPGPLIGAAGPGDDEKRRAFVAALAAATGVAPGAVSIHAVRTGRLEEGVGGADEDGDLFMHELSRVKLEMVPATRKQIQLS